MKPITGKRKMNQGIKQHDLNQNYKIKPMVTFTREIFTFIENIASHLNIYTNHLHVQQFTAHILHNTFKTHNIQKHYRRRMLVQEALMSFFAYIQINAIHITITYLKCSVTTCWIQ